MIKKSLVKKPLSAYCRFINNRKKELQGKVDLNPGEIAELAKEEWNLMSLAEKNPYMDFAKQEKDYFDSIKDQILEIGVDSFMASIKEARKQKEVVDEYKEDDVLSIINHKKNWKTTWSRKKKEALKQHKVFSPLQVKKIAKLKLN